MSELVLYKECITMLKIRGYTVNEVTTTDPDVFRYDFDYENNKFKANTVQNFLISQNKTTPRILMSNSFEKNGTYCLLYFMEKNGENKKISKSEVEIFGKLFNESDYNWAIIVTPGPLSTDAYKHAKSLESTGNIKIQIFNDIDILSKPTSSNLGSKIEQILSPKEEEEFLNENKILKGQIPKILTEDPVAKYYGLLHGQIIKFLRKSLIPGTYSNENYFYRVVRGGEIKPSKGRTKKVVSKEPC